jgi:hypothetical protein
MAISSILLVFQSNICHIIWTWKKSQKHPQKLCHFLGVGDDFNYGKKIPLTKKNLLEFSSHQYWGAWKKNKILGKMFRLLSNTWTLFFKLPQILGPIQVLASS